jgi:hypothetical protein
MGASLDRFHKGAGLAITIDAAFSLRKAVRADADDTQYCENGLAAESS